MLPAAAKEKCGSGDNYQRGGGFGDGRGGGGGQRAEVEAAPAGFLIVAGRVKIGGGGVDQVAHLCVGESWVDGPCECGGAADHGCGEAGALADGVFELACGLPVGGVDVLAGGEDIEECAPLAVVAIVALVAGADG